jgi:hypothetical protein
MTYARVNEDILVFEPFKILIVWNVKCLLNTFYLLFPNFLSVGLQIFFEDTKCFKTEKVEV